MVSIRQKTRNTSGLTFTMAQMFCKQFCGAPSRGVKVSEQVQDHAKQSILSDWESGEHKAKNTKIKVHLPPQRLNHFVNSFVKRVRGVCRYINKPKSMQNKVLLIENYHCVCTPAQRKLCAMAFPKMMYFLSRHPAQLLHACVWDHVINTQPSNMFTGLAYFSFLFIICLS